MDGRLTDTKQTNSFIASLPNGRMVRCHVMGCGDEFANAQLGITHWMSVRIIFEIERELF